MKARLVGHGEHRLTHPRDGEPDAVAIPMDDGLGVLYLPDGPNHPETIKRGVLYE